MLLRDKNCRGGVPTISILVSLEYNRGELTDPHSLPRIPFLFTFMHTLLLFFASTKNSSLFFPINSALFAKETRSGKGGSIDNRQWSEGQLLRWMPHTDQGTRSVPRPQFSVSFNLQLPI